MQHDDDELFLGNGWQTKSDKPYFQPAQLSEILSIANLPHPAIRIWTCAEPGSRICWMKFYITNNQYAGVPQMRKSPGMQYEKNATWKKCNLKKVQYKKECYLERMQHHISTTQSSAA